jgi:hypothetical protein
MLHPMSKATHTAGDDVARERDNDHFHVCGECGQTFDLRSLAQVVHHDGFGHKPLTAAELVSLPH